MKAEQLRREEEERARKLEEERQQKLLEETEQRRRQREQQLFISLETQTAPSFHLKDGDITHEGILYRKNELDEGGRRAANRSWRQFHTVLIGPLLNFYKDKRDVPTYLSACPPINVTHGLCEVAADYVKRKNTLRLKLVNGAEYLFSAKDEAEVSSWVSAINTAIGHTSPLLTPTVRQSTPTLRQTTSANPLTSAPAAATPSFNPLSTSAGSSSLRRMQDSPPDLEAPPPPPSAAVPDEEEEEDESLPPLPLEKPPTIPTQPPPQSVTHEAAAKDSSGKGRKKSSFFKKFGAKF